MKSKQWSKKNNYNIEQKYILSKFPYTTNREVHVVHSYIIVHPMRGSLYH